MAKNTNEYRWMKQRMTGDIDSFSALFQFQVVNAQHHTDCQIMHKFLSLINNFDIEWIEMGQALPLVSDEREISSIATMRAITSAALLYTFTIHYVFMGISYIYSEDTKREVFYDMGRRLGLYGIAALLSMNFLQYGIFHAIMAWLLLFCVIIVDSISFMREVSERGKSTGILIYYGLVFIWYLGILFFYMFNALSQDQEEKTT